MNNKKLLIPVILLLFVSCGNGLNDVYNDFTRSMTVWASSVNPSPGKSEFLSTAIDAQSNLYAAGYVTGSGEYTFGDITAAALNGTTAEVNAVIVKYTPAGSVLWANIVKEGSSPSRFNSISADSQGCVYAAGYITGEDTYNFGNDVRVSGKHTGRSIILVKYSSSGVCLWGKTLTAAFGDSEFNSVSADTNGNVYAVGYISGEGVYIFDSVVIGLNNNRYSGKNSLLVKYNSEGKVSWAQSVTNVTLDGTAGESVLNSAAADAGGNIFAAGYIATVSGIPSVFKFGDKDALAGSYNDGQNALMIKFSSSGELQWRSSLDASSNASCFNSTGVGPDGSVYAAGFITNTGSFDFKTSGGPVPVNGAASGENAVLVMYDSTGKAMWANTNTAASAGSSSFNCVTADSGGFIYTAGWISGARDSDFGSGIIKGKFPGGNNAVIIKFNSTGQALWNGLAEKAPAGSEFGAVTADIYGSFYAAGAVDTPGVFNFGSNDTQGGSSGNALLVKYRN